MNARLKPICTICMNPSPYLMTKDGYDLYRCPGCDLVFVYPQPLENFLKEKVYSLDSGYQSNRKGEFGDAPKDTKTKKIFEVLKGPGNLLDVGCSSGEFMHYAEKQGFTADGVELNKRTADVARSHGLNVFNGFLADAHFADDFFDVIFLGDIIEHVNSPHDLLTECTRILRRGGTMVISTPNLDCMWSRMTLNFFAAFKIPWSSVTPPYHLFQFSSGNLDRILESHGYMKKDELYLRPPRLMYELGSLHMLKNYKENKSAKTLFAMLGAFTLYTIAYGIDFIFTPFKKKDFSMVCFYIKK